MATGLLHFYAWTDVGRLQLGQVVRNEWAEPVWSGLLYGRVDWGLMTISSDWELLDHARACRISVVREISIYDGRIYLDETRNLLVEKPLPLLAPTLTSTFN